jgi:hypothetical protein
MAKHKNMRNIIFALFLAIFLNACNQNNIEPNLTTSINTSTNNIPSASPTEFEIQSLIFMREEEKLAHDVYVFLYQKWGTNIFNNISKSEETHMNSVLTLLNRFKITDPIKSNSLGIFKNDTLQKLYYTLTERGSKSLSEGLLVGAIIEDLDIFDLTEAQKSVTHSEIKLVYDNLLKGSRNHIRSFVGRLSDNGISYKAQYITDKSLSEILTSPMEKGGN